MSLINPFTVEIESKQRFAELYEIAEMDRLAGELAPSSSLRRYARQHEAGHRGLGARIVAVLTGRRHHTV